MKYAKYIGIGAVVLLGIYTAFGMDSEPTLEELIAEQNAVIDRQNDLLTQQYQEQVIQCTTTASGTHTEILSQLESCAKLEKPKLQPRVWESKVDWSWVTNTQRVSWPLRTDLGLTDCRFTNSHHELRGYSWTAYDIACETGKVFKVKAPESKEEWIVSATGYDANCGDYTVLRHADIYFQYCHTYSHHQVWAKIKWGQVIGETNMSGESSGMHVHVAIIRLIGGVPYFLSTDAYYNQTGDMMSAQPLFDMYPDLKFDTLKSKPTAVSGWA